MSAIESFGGGMVMAIGLVVFGVGSYAITNRIGNDIVDAVKGRVMSA